MFTWKEIAIYAVFILVIGFITIPGCTQTEAQNKAQAAATMDMSAEDIEYVMAELDRRAAADCVITQTSYGYVCKELKSGKIFKLKVKKAAAVNPNLAAN
jgi:hypothetical protein